MTLTRIRIKGVATVTALCLLCAPAAAIDARSASIGLDMPAEVEGDPVETSPPLCRRVFPFEGDPSAIAGLATDDLDGDTGIVFVALAPGAVNVTLEVEDSFYPPDPFVGFTVFRTDPSSSGQGVVLVQDGAGNVCTLSADFRDVPAGPLVDFEICSDDGNRLEITNELANPAGFSFCSSNLYRLPPEPALPPGYEPSPDSVVFTIDSPVSGDTHMVFTIDTPFDPRLRLLLSSSSEIAGLASFGTEFPAFVDRTTSIRVAGGQLSLIGDGRWSPIKVTFALLAEICNGLDDDLDGQTDEGLEGVGAEVDADADGFALCPAGGATADCSDQVDFIHPGAPEICNGLDDDCDGAIDDACLDPAQSFVSVSTNQFLAGTRFHQDVYTLPGSGGPIEPFVQSFLPSFVGLDALDVLAGGDLLFSVQTSGGVRHAGGYIVLRQDDVYRFEAHSGTISLHVDWDAYGLSIGSLDALDRLADGSFAFSTASLRGVTHAGGYIVLRPQNVYRFDPAAGTLELLFDGESLGLPDLDGVDVLPPEAGHGQGIAFSTATNRLIRTPAGVVFLEQESVYVYDASDGSVTLALDGEAAGLRSLDAFSLGTGIEL